MSSCNYRGVESLEVEIIKVNCWESEVAGKTSAGSVWACNSLIHTGLQPGEDGTHTESNCFNGFSLGSMRETVKTVPYLLESRRTGLKPGVNEGSKLNQYLNPGSYAVWAKTDPEGRVAQYGSERL